MAVAMVSMIAFATPALAGMVETPKAPAGDAQRDAAIASLKARLVEGGVDAGWAQARLQGMDTTALLVLASHTESLRHAGSTALAVAIGAAVVFAATMMILETFYPWK
jgi:hypothetical protein